MKILPAFCACLLLSAVPTGRGAAAPAPVDATDSQEADLPVVTAEFFKLTKAHRPPLSWRHGMAHGTLTVSPGTPETFKQFRPLRSYTRKKGDFYVVNVFTKGDKEQRPVYLYLLSKEGGRVKLVTAFHYENGKARRIDA